MFNQNIFFHLNRFNPISRDQSVLTVGSERCFVIGLGPSLRKTHLNMLCSGDVFVVNAGMRDPNIRQIKNRISYLVAWDDVVEVFTDSKLAKLQQYSQELDPSTVVFLPYRGRKRVEKYNLFRANKRILLREYRHRDTYLGYFGKVNMPFWIPSPDNAVEIAILVAIQIGYSEIILVGCDSDFFNYDQPVYERSFSDAVATNDMTLEDGDIPYDMTTREAKLFWSYKVYRKYRFLNQFASLNKVNIFDATINGKLDMFQKKDISDFYVS